MTTEETLAMIEALLPNDYSESKDWKHSDIVGRVLWLKSMFESKTKECEIWLDRLDAKVK